MDRKMSINTAGFLPRTVKYVGKTLLPDGCVEYLFEFRDGTNAKYTNLHDGFTSQRARRRHRHRR
jgi:hypothetical protein